MRYYQPAVLAMFYSQSEKYWIQTDEFEGTVRIRDDYLKSQGSTRDKTYLNAAMAHSPCLQARNPKATLRVYSLRRCASTVFFLSPGLTVIPNLSPSPLIASFRQEDTQSPPHEGSARRRRGSGCDV